MTRIRDWLLWLGWHAWRAARWLNARDARVWIAVAFILIGFGLYKGWSLQRQRDIDRVEAGRQRCVLIEHIIAVPDAAGAPPRLTRLLREDLAACRATLAKYQRDAD